MKFYAVHGLAETWTSRRLWMGWLAWCWCCWRPSRTPTVMACACAPLAPVAQIALQCNNIAAVAPGRRGRRGRGDFISIEMLTGQKMLLHFASPSSEAEWNAAEGVLATTFSVMCLLQCKCGKTGKTNIRSVIRSSLPHSPSLGSICRERCHEKKCRRSFSTMRPESQR